MSHPKSCQAYGGFFYAENRREPHTRVPEVERKKRLATRGALLWRICRGVPSRQGGHRKLWGSNTLVAGRSLDCVVGVNELIG